MNSKLNMLQKPIMTKRVRKIAGQGFAFIPHRFLKENFIASLKKDDLALYFFLLLAANRFGVSFYGYDSICSILNMTLDQFIEARKNLIEKDLIAFDGTRFQVLSLPKRPKIDETKPLKSQEDFEKHDPATIRNIIKKQFGDTNK